MKVKNYEKPVVTLTLFTDDDAVRTSETLMEDPYDFSKFQQ